MASRDSSLWPTDAEFARLYDEGFTSTEIAAGVGCYKSTVLACARRHKAIPLAPTRKKQLGARLEAMSDGEFQDIIDRCLEINYIKVCAELGVSVNQNSYRHIDNRIAKIKKQIL